MRNFYIKNENNKYCLIDEKQFDMDGMFLYTLLTEKLKVKASQEAIEAYEKLESLGGFWGSWQQWNTSIQSFFINALAVRTVPLKNNNHETDKFSLADVANNYQNIKIMADSYSLILKFIQSQKTELFALYPKDVKAYVNLEGQYNNFCYSKKINGKDYPMNKFMDTAFFEQAKLASFLSNPFDSLVKAWSKVLNENGVPLKIEENNFYEKFNEKEGYAIFCNGSGQGATLQNSGFWGSTNSSLTDINQAKLFQSEEQAQSYRKKGQFNNVAIVRVRVKFDEVLHCYGSVNVTPLEAAKAAQEKSYLESLATNQEEIKSLAQKLLSVYGESNEALNVELNKIIEEQDKPINNKNTKKKI